MATGLLRIQAMASGWEARTHQSTENTMKLQQAPSGRWIATGQGTTRWIAVGGKTRIEARRRWCEVFRNDKARARRTTHGL